MLHRYLALVVALAVTPLCAAPPTVTNVVPRGAERGKTVEIVVTGTNFAANPRLLLPFKATQTVVAETKPNPAQVRFQVTVDAAVPLGVYPVRLVTDEGVAPLLLFSVDAFPNVNEVKGNATFDKAQKVPVPAIVSGQCSGGDTGFFRISATKGQRLVIETLSARLGSGLVPLIRLTDAKQRFLMADDSQALRGDGRLVFVAPEDGDYVIEMSDSRYRGAAPPFYRLVIAGYDIVEEVFPLGGKRGDTVTFTLRGGSLKEEVRVQRVLDDSATPGYMTLDTGRIGTLPSLIAVGDVPEKTWLKGEGNEPRKLDVLPPLTINSRLERKGDVDRFQFPVEAGQKFRIVVEAENLGSYLDGVLRVSDQTGKQLALVDDVDVPAKVPGQPPTKSVDPSLELTVPTGVTLVVLELRDQRNRGGSNFGYRLTIEPAVPDFHVVLPNSELNVPRGGTAALAVPIVRRGYMGPLQLSVPNLPAHLAAQGGHVPANGTVGILTLTATAPPTAEPALLRIEGKATIDGKEVRRLAEQKLIVSRDANPAVSTLTLPSFAAALTTAEPFGVSGPATVEVVKGYPTTVAVNLKREMPAAMVPIEVVGTLSTPGTPAQPPQPNTFTFVPATAAAGANSATFTLTPGPAVPEGTLDLLVQGKGKVKNVEKSVLGPAVTLTVHSPFTVQVLTPTLELPKGQTVALKAKLARQPIFKEAVQLKLDGLPAGVTLAAPLAPVPAGATDFEVNLKVADKAVLAMANLTLTCTTTINGMAYPHPAVAISAVVK